MPNTRFDVVVIGGGPAGATAAADLAKAGRTVALLDRGGRIKPCGGAVPPRLIADFEIPDDQIVARISTARMISPSHRSVDIAIENGFVGMVDRERFDPFLRARAQSAGATCLSGTFLCVQRESDRTEVVYRDKAGEPQHLATRLIIGADGARSKVARQEIKQGQDIPYVIAYHEIIRPPASPHAQYRPDRCDVIYDGKISPDFYGWVFPHGATASVGMGTGHDGVDLKAATAALRASSGLADCETLRREGAPIPLKPLDRWDNGRDVIVAGDAAGVVAPSSGEGIYYAMVCGQCAAQACAHVLETGRTTELRRARKAFMKEHKTVFRVLQSMQDAYYRSDDRRERFVSLCHDLDVQRLTFEAYMNKELVHARPLAHLKIGLKNLLHLTRLVPPAYT